MSSLENNKIFAAILTAGVVGLGSGFVAELLVYPERVTEVAYPVPEVASAAADAAAPALEPVLPLLAGADLAKGEAFARNCTACHSFEAGGANKVGPALYGVVGRDIASAAGFAYSKALLEKEGPWNYQHLNEFLAKPKTWAPGTKMAYAGIRKVEDRANMIAWLRTLSDSPAPLPTDAEIAAVAAPGETGGEPAAPAEPVTASPTGAEGDQGTQAAEPPAPSAPPAAPKH